MDSQNKREGLNQVMANAEINVTICMARMDEKH